MVESTASGPKKALPIRLLQVLEGHQGAVYDLCADDAGNLLSVGGDGWVVRWKKNGHLWAVNGHALARLAAPIFTMVSMPHGLRAGTGNGEVVDIGSDGQWSSKPVHQGAVCCVTEWGSGGADGKWVPREDESNQAEVAGRIRCVLHLGEEDLIGTSEGHIHARRGGWHVKAHEGAVRALMAWPGKEALASVGGDGRLRIWQPADDGLSALVSLDAHKGSVYRLAASPSGRLVASCSRDRTVAFWNAEDLTLVARVGRPAFEGHVRSINALCWLSDDAVATAGDDGRILVWALGEEGAGLGDYF